MARLARWGGHHTRLVVGTLVGADELRNDEKQLLLGVEVKNSPVYLSIYELTV